MAIHFHIAAAETWFLVPASVVTEHLAKATETELKVLLRLLHGGREADEQDLLRTLSLTERQLKEAVAAWISRGVLCMEGSLVTLAQPPLTFAKPERRTAQAPARPEYRMEEVEQALAQNEALREVLRRAPQALGREVGPTEFARLYSLYDYYGLSPEAILRLFAYCHALRRTSWMSLEQVASNWQVRGISTGEEAEKALVDLAARQRAEGLVRRIFGLGDRNLSPTEKNYIAHWTGALRFEEPLLELAYNRGVDRIGKLSFHYVNRILESWAEKGIRTLEEAEAEALPPRRAAKKGARVVDTAQAASFDTQQYDDWSFQQIYSQAKGEEPS